MNRARLPDITDSPKAAFLNGWWSGIAVGILIGLAIAVMAWTSMKGHP